MRSTAVLCVLGFHAQMFGWRPDTAWFSFSDHVGHMGVLLFFVHTSLVLLQSLERRAEPGWGGHRSLLNSSCVAHFSALLLGRAIVPIARVPMHPWLSFESVSLGRWLSSFGLIWGVTGYRPVLGVLWSLPYEVLMYIVLPAVYVALQRSTYRTTTALVMWATSVAVASVVGGNNFVSYVPCFLAGGLAFVLPRRPALPAWLWPVWLGGLVCSYSLVVQELTEPAL
jgi:peptidoglycan/LPS O-acetylase OafA/YrhL